MNKTILHLAFMISEMHYHSCWYKSDDILCNFVHSYKQLYSNKYEVQNLKSVSKKLQIIGTLHIL